jgi:hypothetical protein
MLDMALNSGKLFFTGKLFKDNKLVMRQLAIGVAVGAAVIVVLAQFAPLWAAAIAGGAVSGFLQPMLFKDLKYA